MTIARIRIGMKRLSIFCGGGALGLAASSARCCCLAQAASDGARADERRTARRRRLRRSSDASCRLSLRAPGRGLRAPESDPRPRGGDSIPGRFADSNLWPGRAGRTGRHQSPRRSRAWARRCQSRVDPHRGLEVHPGAEQRLELLAGRGPGVRGSPSALADHDPLLRVALDADRRPAAAGRRRPVVRRRGRGRRRRRSSSSAVTAIECGSSSRAIAQQLLAQQLGGEERLGLVGDDAVRVVVRALGQPGLELGDERVDARRRCAPTAGRRRRTRRARPTRPRGARRRSPRLGDVDLVHDEDRRRVDRAARARR